MVSRLAGQLKLFQGISKTEGFLEQLAKAFSELRAHCQTPQSLRAVQEFFEGDEVISAKLHDIALLYEAYQQFISERFREPKARSIWLRRRSSRPRSAGRRSLGRRLCGIYASRVCAGVAPFRGSAGHHRAVHRAQRTGRRRLGVVVDEGSPAIFFTRRESLVRLRELKPAGAWGLRPLRRRRSAAVSRKSSFG